VLGGLYLKEEIDDKGELPERPARPEELDEHDAWLADWQARHTDPEALARRNQE